MNIPNIPTDSLYKTLAIGGLIITILSGYFMLDYFIDVDDRIRKAITENEALNYEHEVLKEEADSNSLKWNEIGVRAIANKNEFIGIKEYQANYNSLLTTFSLLFSLGLLLSIVGFHQWYVKVQKYQDKIIRNEADKYIHENKIKLLQVQFEKEFDVYSDLWVSLVKLRRATVQLRPKGELVSGNETDEERRERKGQTFRDTFNLFLDTYQQNKPFYPKAIFDLAKDVAEIANGEGWDFIFINRPEKDDYEEIEKNMKKLTDLIDLISDKIQQRIGLIEIVEK